MMTITESRTENSARTAAECVAIDRAHRLTWAGPVGVALGFFAHLVAFEDALEANLELFCGEQDAWVQ